MWKTITIVIVTAALASPALAASKQQRELVNRAPAADAYAREQGGTTYHCGVASKRAAGLTAFEDLWFKQAAGCADDQ